MKLAIAQIGADIEAPSSLIESGQYSVSALESLLKKWLHHAINQLKVDISDTGILAGKQLILDDINIELPDIDLDALNADPQGYFESVFSPVIRRIFKLTIETRLHAEGVVMENVGAHSIHRAEEIPQHILDGKVLQYVKDAFIRSLTTSKSAFIALMKSAEWPAIRNVFIRAMCSDATQLATWIQALAAQQQATSVDVLSKLTTQKRFSFWLDFESVLLSNQSSSSKIQERILVLSQAYRMFSGKSANDDVLLDKIVAVLKRPACDVKLLKTWFVIKSSYPPEDNDRRTLARVANSALAKPSASYGLLLTESWGMSSASMEAFIDEFGGFGEVELPNGLSFGAGMQGNSIPIYHELKEGFRSSYRALKKLSALLNHRSENPELSIFDRKQWVLLFNSSQAIKDLPQPIYRLLVQLKQALVCPQSRANKQLKKIEYLLKLVEREHLAIKSSPERLFNYVYANRIRALMCAVEDAPSDILKRLQSHCAAVRVMGAPLQKNVNLEAYSALLNALSYWLINRKNAITISQIDAESTSYIFDDALETNSLLISPPLASYVHDLSASPETHATLSQPVVPLILELQGPVSLLVARQQSKDFTQAQVAQYRLILCVIKQRLDTVAKSRLDMQLVGADLEVLKLLVQKYSTEQIIQTNNDDIVKTTGPEEKISCDIEKEIERNIKQFFDSILSAVDSTYVALEQHNIAQSIESSQRSVEPKQPMDEVSPMAEKVNVTGIDRLKEVHLLEVLARLRAFIAETIHQMRSLDSNMGLVGLYQLVEECAVCCLRWRTLFTADEALPMLTNMIHALDLSSAKLQKLQSRIKSLNPYLEGITQKTSTWWAGFLADNANEVAFLNKSKQQVEDAYRDKRRVTSAIATKLKDGSHALKGLETADLLEDLISMQTASSFESIQKALVQFIEKLEGVLLKQHRPAPQSEQPQLDAAPKAVLTERRVAGSNGPVLSRSEGELYAQPFNNVVPVFEKTTAQGQTHSNDAAVDKTAVDIHVLEHDFERQYYASAQRILDRSKALMGRLSIQVQKQNTRIQEAGLEQLKYQTTQALSSAKHAYQFSTQKLISEDAGIVLLWPFFETLFRKLALLCEDESNQTVFCDEQSQQKAHQLLCYLVGTDPLAHETYAINALLGLPLEHMVEHETPLNDAEQTELERLLDVSISRWEALKGMPNNTFMEMFLRRSGEVNLTANGVSIVVETKPQDILMMKLPWGLGIAQLPWLGNDLINIEWKYGV
ncbi:hypothetical protein L1286_11065 [Pseudoalteromonas sp. SMS1]|uniref:contractile injection system tape measure protein n=1 Tax=Pseudoalteromonas sp. SMS1 TaxID=2908894 RepID=UPI001EED7B51|nr:contractile injection system tape measure protein [Pseudoalteromonas sp. SMS1]MCF2858012.1 hypothetical protein [Pseudoalteromonas sp. SMS1]